MKKRIIYPGQLNPPEIIIISGAINNIYLAEASNSLATGIRSKGYSCSVCWPSMVRNYVESDQSGDPLTFDYSSDVTLIVMGEYLGFSNFRQGVLPSLDFSRCVFFTPLANPVMSHSERFPWELERIEEMQLHLFNAIQVPVNLAATSLIRPSGTEKRLSETSSEVLQYIESKTPVPTLLQNKRKLWKNANGMDQLPALERPLW